MIKFKKDYKLKILFLIVCFLFFDRFGYSYDCDILRPPIGNSERVELKMLLESFEKFYKINGEPEKTHPVYGIYFGASPDFIVNVFNKIALKGKNFLDLGSGDGRAVMLAALFGAVSRGVEHNETIFMASVRLTDKFLQELGIVFERHETENSVRWTFNDRPGSIELKRESFNNEYFGDIDVLYVFNNAGGIEPVSAIGLKIIKECKIGSLLIQNGVAVRPYILAKNFSIIQSVPGVVINKKDYQLAIPADIEVPIYNPNTGLRYSTSESQRLRMEKIRHYL